MPYQVQIYTFRRIWMNAITSDTHGSPQSVTFPTRAEAEEALDELFADIAADHAAGLCPPWRPYDFRIECVRTPESIDS